MYSKISYTVNYSGFHPDIHDKHYNIFSLPISKLHSVHTNLINGMLYTMPYYMDHYVHRTKIHRYNVGRYTKLTGFQFQVIHISILYSRSRRIFFPHYISHILYKRLHTCLTVCIRYLSVFVLVLYTILVCILYITNMPLVPSFYFILPTPFFSFPILVLIPFRCSYK